MLNWKLPICLAAVLLTGCGITGPARIVDTGCSWTRPIYVSKADILTDQTAVQILAHNETGAKRCRWKPAAKTR